MKTEIEESENPFLDVRRSWNGAWESSLVSERRAWRIVFIVSGLLALSIFGLIHLGEMPKAIVYGVKINARGEASYLGRLDPTQADRDIVSQLIETFIHDLRWVTTDAALQREFVTSVYAYISKGDPAFGRVNSFYGATKGSSPYIRAQDELVSVQIDDVLPTSQNSWQVDWTETTHDRKTEKEVTSKWRGLVTIVIVPPTTSTPEDQLRRNPLGIYVQDVTWSQLN